jgi:DNA-binding SARP family transcriptional activator/transcriptional regulator with XRE-family HTH domain
MGHGTGPAIQFGTLVRIYRHEAQLTQRELAAKAGLSVAALRDFEQGRRRRPRQNSLAALALALGLSADEAAGLARAAAEPRRKPEPGEPARSAPQGYDVALPAGLPGQGQGLWVAVLGPLQAWHDGTPLPLGPPTRRAVLGLLLMEPGALLRRDTIIDVLWGDNPPRTAVSLVHAHLSRIRRLLEPGKRAAGGDRALDSVSGGYRLLLSARELDLLAFRGLAWRAAAAQAGGDIAAATELYGHATGLWRGDPFADVDVLSADPGVTALKQELAGVLLSYADAACALGQPYRVLPRLQTLADAEPLNELAHARLMIALACAGQQAAAIGVYEGIRLRLDHELGLYPGEEIGEAYLRVLRQDVGPGSGGRPRAQPPALTVTAHGGAASRHAMWPRRPYSRTARPG